MQCVPLSTQLLHSIKKKGKNVKKAKNKSEMLPFLPITSSLPVVANHCLEDVCFEMNLDSRKFPLHHS